MRKSLVLGAILGLAMTPAMAEEVSLFAAGSLEAALSEVAEDYTSAYRTPVSTSFGPSGLMRERIETGVVAHVFTSANMRHPRTLESAGQGGPVALFARNRLCGLARPDVTVSPDTLLEVMLRRLCL